MSAAAEEPLHVAALQYCAGGSFDETRPQLEPLITAAARGGAGLVCLPEAATFLAASRRSLDAEAEWEDDSPTLRRLSTLAADLGIELLVGSTFVRRRQDARIVNRSVLIGADGTAKTSYDKIHMFDANVGDGRQYRESDHFAAGNRLVFAETRGLRLSPFPAVARTGMSCCGLAPSKPAVSSSRRRNAGRTPTGAGHMDMR